MNLFINIMADSTDVEDVASIGERFHAITGSRIPYNQESFEAFLFETIASTQTSVLIAREGDDKRFLGCIGLVVHPVMFNIYELVCSELFWWMQEDARGLGVGGVLLDHAEQWARNNGAKHMHMIALRRSMSETLDDVYKARGYFQMETLYAKEL